MSGSASEILLLEQKDTISQLNKKINELVAAAAKNALTIEEQSILIKNQQEQIEYLTKKLFGSSSEKSKDIEGQMSLFDEAEQEADFSVPDFEDDIPDQKKPRTKKSHSKQFRGVPVIEETAELPEEERVCSICGTGLVAVGREFVREEFRFTPAKGQLVRHYVTTYKCPECTDGEDPSKNAQFKKASAPEPLLEKSFASPSLAAWIIYQKYMNAMPLYRQEKDWMSQGVSISRTTMANWIIKVSETYFRPLYEHIHHELLRREFLMADETRVQVLNEKDRRPETESFMWLFRSGEDGLAPIVLFRYTETRARFNAVEFLEGFSGYLETDGYQGYNNLPNVRRCGCWAHVRRYFFDAVPKGSELDITEPAVQALQFIDKLFKVEKYCQQKKYDHEQRHAFRLEKALPLIEAFWKWLDKQKPVKGSRFDKAVKYARNQKAYLSTYLEDGRCSFSNNLSENSIRPFTVGRRNWLFSDTPKGAEASSICYTMIELAKLNGLNVLNYLIYLLENRPDKDMSDEELEKYMPWNETVFQTCKLDIE